MTCTERLSYEYELDLYELDDSSNDMDFVDIFVSYYGLIEDIALAELFK